MSEPLTPESAQPSFRERYLRLPRRPRTRLVALGAAAVVVLAGGAAVACHVAHRHGEGREQAVAQPWGGHNKRGGKHGYGSHGQWGGKGEAGGQQLAPAPVPAFPADQAAQKAAAAVPGGKVDSLQVVGEQGGGSAWQLDVLGQDGVRHLITVDGTSGSVTSNTVATNPGEMGD